MRYGLVGQGAVWFGQPLNGFSQVRFLGGGFARKGLAAVWSELGQAGVTVGCGEGMVWSGAVRSGKAQR